MRSEQFDNTLTRHVNEETMKAITLCDFFWTFEFVPFIQILNYQEKDLIWFLNYLVSYVLPGSLLFFEDANAEKMHIHLREQEMDIEFL